MTIRPVLSIPEGIELRDTLRRVVVYNTLNSFLLEEERDTLMMFELKLTKLIGLAETNAAIADLKQRRAGPETS